MALVPLEGPEGLEGPSALVPLEVVEEHEGPSALVPLEGEKTKSAWDEFQLPYKVATVEKFELRAFLQNDSSQAEWLWVRMHEWCKISTPSGRMLALNQKSIHTDMDHCQVPHSDFHYRGRSDEGAADTAPWKKSHTFGSTSFFVMLMWLVKNRTLKSVCKVKAIELFLGMARACMSIAFALDEPILAMVLDTAGCLKHGELFFEAGSFVCRDGWGELLQNCPGGAETWAKLSRATWLDYCITTTLEAASLFDILFFLIWIAAHPTCQARGQSLFKCIALHNLPSFVKALGSRLDLLAVELSKQALSPLPVLKTKHGIARRLADPVNRVVLLYRLRKAKLNRRAVAETHGESVGEASSRFIQFEDYIDSLLHSQALRDVFGGRHHNQVSICWDPSTYNGKEILVSAIYSPHLDKAAWLMNQQLTQVMMSEVVDELLPMAKQSKLTRVDGYKELRGVSAALSGVGLSLIDFQPPSQLWCQPLEAHQVRIPMGNGAFAIFNEKTNELCPQIPPHLDLAKLPILVSISDQGPVNSAALNYLQYSPQAILISTQFDCFHRCWNDLKLAYKRCAGRAWRVLLQLTLVCNLPYGPFGSSAWFYKLRAQAEEYLSLNTSESESWERIHHLVCMENRIDEPRTREEAEALFSSIRKMPCFCEKGPLIKLMRWFSVFQSFVFMEGQWFVRKLILEQGTQQNEQDCSDADGPEITEHQDAAKQLQELKRKKGAWRLAPTLITEASITMKDVILSTGKSCWKIHSARARDITSPEDMLAYNVACSSSKEWAAELEGIIESSLWDVKTLQHLLPQWCMHESALSWQCDMFEKVLEARAMSLVAFHELPPNCYHHSLALSADVALGAFEKAKQHWSVLLEAEAANAAGTAIGPLQTMYWRLSPLNRCLLLAYEQDNFHKRYGANSQAKQLQLILAKTLGDSRIVEVGHQHSKDLLRASKSNSFSNTSIFAKLLRSSALGDRKVSTVSVSAAEKVQASVPKGQALGQAMKASSHKLPKDIQSMMLKQTWPSPAPSALFQSAASTEWLMHFWQNKETFAAGVGAAWLSILAMPGSCIAQQSTGSLLKVVASAEFSFLAWELSDAWFCFRSCCCVGVGVVVLVPVLVQERWHLFRVVYVRYKCKYIMV